MVPVAVSRRYFGRLNDTDDSLGLLISLRTSDNWDLSDVVVKIHEMSFDGESIASF